MSLKGKKILVGLTGGIACYKVPYLIRSLTKAEAEVRVVMTDSATKFITPLTLETVSNNPVATAMFPADRFVGTRHIDLAEWPDLVVVAPATANFLGKVGSGVSDDLLTTIICATPRQVMIAPAMNPGMWHNPITQRNYKTLLELGYISVGPEEGDMACEHVGVGRMAEPQTIFEAIESYFKSARKKKALEGKKILITAGPTREAIDPVRYLSNHSSGKMGYALAASAVKMGAEATLISGPVTLPPPKGAKLISINTTEELHRAVIKHFKQTDCLIMAAAPADFKVHAIQGKKIKRSDAKLTLQLEPTTDILKDVAKVKKPGQQVIGFALETDNARSNAIHKLKEKNLDLIVLNQPGPDSGFNTDTNRVTIIYRNGRTTKWPLLTKQEVADRLLEKVSEKL